MSDLKKKILFGVIVFVAVIGMLLFKDLIMPNQLENKKDISNKQNNEQVINSIHIDKIKDSFDALNYSVNIISYSLHQDTLNVSLNIEKPPIEDSSHIGYLLTYCSQNFSNNLKSINYKVGIYNQKEDILNIRYFKFKKENLTRIDVKLKDFRFKKIYRTALKTLNQFDTPILNMYINMIHQDFPDIKMEVEFFELISLFHDECTQLPKGEYGKAGRTLLLIYSMDKELDPLKNESVISKKLKVIWESSMLRTDIDTSLDLLLNS
jgi:hypothetical protein